MTEPVTTSNSTAPTETVARLRALPISERMAALTAIVVAEFRETLLMDDDEDLPLTQSYFSLGFTSLRVVEIKKRLEALLGTSISANVLFSEPTVEHMIAYLARDVVADLFARTDTGPAPRVSAPEVDRQAWDDVLTRLYQS